MIYVKTAVAAEIFGVSLSALKEAARRNSQKIPICPHKRCWHQKPWWSKADLDG